MDAWCASVLILHPCPDGIDRVQAASVTEGSDLRKEWSPPCTWSAPPKGRPMRVGISERSLGIAEAHGSFIGGHDRRRNDEAPEPAPGR